MTKIEKIILPLMVSILITLVSYIYIDFKSTNKEQLAELRNICSTINTQVVDGKIIDNTLMIELKDHEKRITKLEE